MADDPTLKMYEAQAELVETRQELERIRRENDELKKERAVIDDFQRSNSNRLETMEKNLRKLTTTVSNQEDAFTQMKKTIQFNFNNLFTKISSGEQILLNINETLTKQNQTLRKQNDILEIQREEIQILKKSMETMDEETILLLGGWSGGKAVDSLLILQNNGENDESWDELNIKLPYGVWCHGAQFLNNYLYIFGGTNEEDEVLNSSYKLTRGHKWLTENSLKWEKITDMNEKRASISNSSVILNDRIWVIGGKDEENYALKSVEMYDPQTNIWTNKKEMNEHRNLAAAAVVNGKIFCCGGSSGYDFVKSAECYDPFSDIWTYISDMPGPNVGCGAVEMDGHLIVIGGRTKDRDFLNSVWVLDTTDKNGKWIEKEPRLSRPLNEFGIAKIHGEVVVCGGLYIDKEDSIYSTEDVEVFDGQVWRAGPKLTTYLRDTAAVVISVEFARDLEPFIADLFEPSEDPEESSLESPESSEE